MKFFFLYRESIWDTLASKSRSPPSYAPTKMITGLIRKTGILDEGLFTNAAFDNRFEQLRMARFILVDTIKTKF